MQQYQTEKLNINIITEDDIARHSSSFILLGVISIFAGGIALMMPHIASIAIELLIGGLLVFDGVLQLFNYYQLRDKQSFSLRLFSALLSIVAGGLLLAYPLIGVLSLTFLLGSFFLIVGIIRFSFAFKLKPQRSWLMMLISALVSLVFGLLVLAVWPEASAWLIGMLVGIDMIVSGTWLLTLSIYEKTTSNE